MRTPTTPYRVTKSEGVTYVIDDEALLVAKIYDWPDQTVEGKHANLFAAAPYMLDILTRLTEKVARANSIQHSGGRILPEDWSELYMLQNEARAALAKAQPTSAERN